MQCNRLFNCLYSASSEQSLRLLHVDKEMNFKSFRNEGRGISNGGIIHRVGVRVRNGGLGLRSTFPLSEW